MMANALQLPRAETGTAQYGDVLPADWHYNAVMRARSAGLLDRFTEPDFRPNAPITRIEMTNILAAILRLHGFRSVEPDVFLITFLDSAAIASPTNTRNAAMVHHYGLMNGINATHFAPFGHTTRAQAATVQIRLLVLLKYIPDPDPASATIMQPVRILPSSAILEAGETITFRVSGGNGSITGWDREEIEANGILQIIDGGNNGDDFVTVRGVQPGGPITVGSGVTRGGTLATTAVATVNAPPIEPTVRFNLPLVELSTTSQHSTTLPTQQNVELIVDGIPVGARYIITSWEVDLLPDGTRIATLTPSLDPNNQFIGPSPPGRHIHTVHSLTTVGTVLMRATVVLLDDNGRTLNAPPIDVVVRQ
jgi:hypothetical protein